LMRKSAGTRMENRSVDRKGPLRIVRFLQRLRSPQRRLTLRQLFLPEYSIPRRYSGEVGCLF
jgi:hypothetical protein